MRGSEQEDRKTQVLLIGLLCFLAVVLLFKFKSTADYIAFQSEVENGGEQESGSSKSNKDKDKVCGAFFHFVHLTRTISRTDLRNYKTEVKS